MTMEQDKTAALYRSGLLPITAFALLTLLLVSIYGFGLAHAVPRQLPGALEIFLVPFVIPALFSPLFAGPGWFFALLGLALLLAVVTLRVWRGPRLVRALLAVGTLLLIAAPLLLPLLYGRYTLAVEPREGVQMFWLTEPNGLFASAFKSAQRVHERAGCDYELLGWGEGEVLYYEAVCDGQVWAFDPAADDAPRRVVDSPVVLDYATMEGAVPRGTVRVYPSSPEGFPPGARNHVITYQKSVSPQGTWEAAAIMNYYGPRDVVVLGRLEIGD